MTKLTSPIHEARRTAPPGTFLSQLPADARVAAAAAPIPPQGDVTMMFMPTMGHTIPKTPVGGAFTDIETVERSIRNDPRESFYWTLPNKLTPQQCLQMLRAALAGDLFQQFNLCQLMLDTWPTFRMASHQLMESAAYMRYAVHPYAEEGKKPSKRAMEKADLVSRAMRAMEPNPFNDELGFSGMIYKTCDAMLNGISLTELLWAHKASSDHGREWLPQAAAWVHPRHFTFSTDGNIALYTDDSDRINSGVLGYRPGMMPDINKFICGQFISRAGSSLGAGFMRPLVWYWAARQFNNEWMLNTAKQYGSPFIDITYKPGTVSTGPGSELEKLNEMLKTAGPQRRLLHPEGTTATIHQPSSLGKENPQRVMEEKADEACLFLLLGQKGTTTSVSGQLGNDDSHENVKEERKLGLASWVARNPLRQFARAVLTRNYGNADECPNIEPDTTKPLKPEQVGQMATSISSSRIPVRADEFYKKIGFTQPDEGEIVLTGGVLGIQGKALTDEERFEQDLGKQTKQAEVQMELQAEADGAAPARGSEGQAVNIMVKASNPEGHNQWTSMSSARSFTNKGMKMRADKNTTSAIAFSKSANALSPVIKADPSKRRSMHRDAADAHFTAAEAAAKSGDKTLEAEHRRICDQHEDVVRKAYRAGAGNSDFDNLSDVEKGIAESGMEQEGSTKARDLTLSEALVHATDEELAELEAKLTAAEQAEHRNGEITAVELAVEKIHNRIKF